MTTPDPPAAEQLNDDDEPKTAYVRRIARRAGWIHMSVFFVSLFCGMLINGGLTRGWWGMLELITIWVTASFLAHFAQLWFLRRARRRLESCKWSLCDCCGYDTAGAGESSTCPECGVTFSASRLRDDFVQLQYRARQIWPFHRLVRKGD